MIAAVFPGQGSQKPGMGKALHDAAPWTRDVFKRVFDATGTNVAHLCFDADDETLRQTQNAQLALMPAESARLRRCGSGHLRCGLRQRRGTASGNTRP
jgi:[acyl-carrier-protein] S-malonyltransferase